MRFDEWITKRYLRWRGDAIGHERTVRDFAEWIGVGQSLMVQWMRPPARKGKVPRSHNSVSKLVTKFGDEVYLVLGLEPQPMDRIVRLVSQLPPEAYELVEKRIREVMSDYDVIEISSSEGDDAFPDERE
jgi:hypothetical protein